MILRPTKSKMTELHHGMCVGGDSEIHDLVRVAFPQVEIHGHPPTDKKYFKEVHVDVLWPEAPYIERNHDIVNACDVLIGCPRYMHPELRSGTWSTIRYGLEQEKIVLVVWPSGMVSKGEEVQ
jgi:hypothetical protein